MKELDVLLERFLAAEYHALDAPQRSAFEHLLDADDPELYAWLVAGAAAPDPAHAAIIRRIRAC